MCVCVCVCINTYVTHNLTWFTSSIERTCSEYTGDFGPI